MSKPDLIPLKDMDRANPMIWDGEEAAEGVFLDSGDSGDPLALLGASAFQPREEPRLPADFEVSAALRERLQQLQHTVRAAAAGPTRPGPVDVSTLNDEDRESLRLMLGRGEVSGRLSLDGVTYQLTESLMTGLWHVSGSDDSEWLEAGPVPMLVEQAASSLAPAPVSLPPELPGVMNGLAVLAEVNEHAAAWSGAEPHNRVLNFTLMPMSPEDQQLLIDVLGRADLVLESGGFGQCKVLATTVRNVWAVQYENAMGNTILDTLEIGRIPDAALAAQEDFEDSARRLDQILETYLL